MARAAHLIGHSFAVASLALLTGCAGVNKESLCHAATSETACTATQQALHDDEPVGSIPPPQESASSSGSAVPSRLASSSGVPPADGFAIAASRSAVPPELRVASLEPGSSSDASPQKVLALPKAAALRPTDATKVGELSLADAVAIAVLSHPSMGAQAAKVKGAVADKRATDALFRPSLEVSAGAGQGTLGSYSNYPIAFGNPNIVGAKRADLGFTFRQLVYDFGSASAEAARSRAVVDAEQLRLADQAEDIALRTVNSYLNLLEQKELLAAIEKSLARQKGYANLVRVSEANGNSTKTDIDRIQTKVIEADALKTDIQSAYQVALDEFRRLTGLEPQQVHRPSGGAVSVPASPAVAVTMASTTNPSLLALKSTGDAMHSQLSGLKAQNLPRVDLQSDGLLKHYVGGAHSASQGILDMRAMVTLSYKITDGGLLSSQTDRVHANLLENDFKQLDQRETIELDVRRLYQTLSSSSLKRAAAVRGYATARSVSDHYAEQFKAGKRTIFELLESETSLFAMDKNRISGEFDELRARYGILRQLGTLNAKLAGT